MTKKSMIFVNISLVLILLLGIGLSYSMWNITVNQDTVSTMHTDCFDLTISNKENNISLENTYPISNSKGIKLTPYTFTVTNTCDVTAEYSINLEVLNNSTLSSQFIDVMLDGNINLLNSYDETDKVDSNSIESRKLDAGILKSGESKDYSLRLWIDYDTTLEDLNNETKVFKSKVTIVGKPINYTGDTVFNFDYTGGEQTFTVPVSGTYKLETWGAQSGASSGSRGSWGGYSIGNIKVEKSKIIYVNVGGAGKSGKGYIQGVETITEYGEGGYNGGGHGQNGGYYKLGNYTCASGAGGGGATHIATKSGILSSLKNYTNNILIVSGGAGAGGGFFKKNENVSHGGGFKSFSSSNNSATQENGYDFGQGIFYAEQAATEGAGGGGGGYYGGLQDEYAYSSGGSGYIGNQLLTNKIMYCYNCEESSEVSTKTISTTCSEETPTSYCAKKGNGYARITLVSID